MAEPAKEELVEVLTMALRLVDEELFRQARTSGQQAAARAFLDHVENIGERTRNEAADRYNVYPLRPTAYRGPAVIDRDRERLMTVGAALMESAGRLIRQRHEMQRHFRGETA